MRAELQAERARVVAEALSWERTPFGHRQRVKGVQVDCAGFVAEVYERTGMIDRVELPDYTRDWFNHPASAGIYLERIERWFERLIDNTRPEPGDLATYRWGVTDVGHAAIVVDWPSVVYASSWSFGNKNVQRGEGDRGPLGHRLSGLWTLKRWARG